MDRTAIATAVYVAFSAAVVGGIWTQLDGREIAIVLGVDALLLGSAFGGTWLLGGLLALRLPDRITLLFSGTQRASPSARRSPRPSFPRRLPAWCCCRSSSIIWRN